MFLLIVFLILVIGVFVAWKYGVFDQFKMEEGHMKSCQVLYLKYQGEYSKIGPLFE